MFGISDDADPMLVNFRVLTLAGCWAINSEVPWKRLLYSVYRALNVSLFALMPVLEIVDVFNVLDDVAKLNYNLSVNAFSIMDIFQIVVLLRNQEGIAQCQERLRANFDLPWIGVSEEHREALKKNDINYRKLLRGFFTMVFTSVTIWSIIPLFDTPPPGEVVTPLRAWFPFDQTKTPNYQLVWALEAYMMYLYAGSILPMDMAFIGFVYKFCGHFEMLIGDLKTLGSRFEDKEGEEEGPDEERRTYRQLQRNAIYHQQLVKETLEFESQYSKIILIHFAGMAVLLCVEVFDIVMVPRSRVTISAVAQLNSLISCLTHTFMYCIVGQKLIDLSDDLSVATYDVPWWNMSPRCQKLLLQMTVYAQRPPTMTGQGFFPVNMETFGSLVQLSYNMLAMLEQMQDEEA